GNGFDTSTDIGPLISNNQKEKVLGYLDQGLQQGAELVVGGDATEREYSEGHFIKPSILANVTKNMQVFQEEIFGTVVSAIPFKEIDEVIKYANNSISGLAGGVHRTDVRKAHKVSHAIKTGTIWVNSYGLLDAASPYGGYKQS